MSTTFEYSIIVLCRCNTCRKLVTLKTRPQNSTFFLSSRCPNCNVVWSIEKITREQLSESLLTSSRPFFEDFPNDPHIPNPYIYIPRNHNTHEEGFDCYYDDGSGFGFTQVQPEYLAPSRQVFNQGISQFGFSEFNLLPRVDEKQEEVVGLVVWRLAGDIVGLGMFSGGERIFEVIFRDTPESLISRDHFRGNNSGVRKRCRFRRVFKSLLGVGRAIIGSN